MRASASTNAAAERCWTATPLGVPVEPDVKMTHASSSGPGGLASGNGRGRLLSVTIFPPARRMPATLASPKTSLARSSGSSASTGTYAAPTSSTARIET